MTKKASDSEMTVLTALLERGEATVADLHVTFEASHGWAHSTVVTFLRRLEAKGLVTHTRPRGQRAFVYRPTAKARSTRQRVIRDVLERVFGGNPLPLVSSLLEQGDLSQEQLEELQRMIERQRRKE